MTEQRKSSSKEQRKRLDFKLILTEQIRQNDLYKLCRCTLFKNAADFAETMDMLEEYNYLHRETIQGANGNNKSGIMVFINPNI